ncbi:glutamate synthase large subunit [Arthrobacter sp. MYb213]|uniref:glutamate synthase large subunit n=1 Tax=Arthrobacter sp. MYb213 TaxID=1848595 RepID=UPI000CFDB529|nr:glutamate synthase large subunit [Arthrobacter sp. MYb213]PRB72207.1 glutamate synthase large subunit [Arthrobacter sp. MYb213]
MSTTGVQLNASPGLGGEVTSPYTRFSAIPPAQGLYDPAAEKDACGLAMIASLKNAASHQIVTHALTALRRLEHRGAIGADEGTGDGAGILLHLPDGFFRAVTEFELPAAGTYAVGMGFLPAEPGEAEFARNELESLAAEESLRVLGWREVPVDASVLGASARKVMPKITQFFVTGSATALSSRELDAAAWRIRRRAHNKIGVYFASFSAQTIVYKGMVSTAQLEPFYPDLSDARFASRCAIVHSRFSTNTFPSWPLAQPFRSIAHNGEINTVKGNRNWMRARQSTLSASLLGEVPEELFPICTPGASDSASFDEVAEMLMLSGRNVSEAIMMMIPQPWENDETMDADLRAFYEYHSMLIEPWDGPAAVCFTDGQMAGAVLDRNGLRPARWWVTDEDLVVLASEVGVIDTAEEHILAKGRVAPGKMFAVDLAGGRIVADAEIKAQVAAAKPWRQWVDANLKTLDDFPDLEHVRHSSASVQLRQLTFGYTTEELRILLAPMASTGAEPLAAMGTDTPIAALADRPRLLFDYFTQSFAQVTNPPLDAIREELVTSMGTSIGPDGNLLSLDRVPQTHISLDYPVLSNDQLAKIVNLRDEQGEKYSLKVRGLYRPAGGESELRARLQEICEKVSAAVNRGVRYLVLSDRDSSAAWAPIPSLLLTSAVHHHLLKSSNRTRVSLIIESGDAREVHHIAALIGYGASAINPYLALESVEELAEQGELPGVDGALASSNLRKALGKGVLKIMSKMGISTVSSYCGAQTFEAIGLSKRVVDQYFTGTTTKLSGIELEVVAAEAAARHARAYPENSGGAQPNELETGGEYQWRRNGPPHLFDPQTVFRLQHSTRTRRYDVFKQYTQAVDDQATQLKTLRGLLEFDTTGITPIDIDQVEPVSEIVKRFATGAMSYGSISAEAHETLAIAMNQLGAKSNTGEGGEDPERLLDPARRSAVKQIASGRFGVTSLYLTNADDIQIKMAQGAKPGEGGQLMSQKLYPWVAKTRHSTPGVGLISPPPHHDIYSIEDLAQLIHDAKCSNPSARVHVKLVSESGIGTVAAGVAKAKADVVLISGHDGGTGASPMNSLKHAGTPWELGLAEAQQTLILNGLRDRVTVQVDGQLKTGRDVLIGALLGAEEFGFATAPLVVSGCIMMRVCHLDTCPVGVATQNPKLRERFTGKAEFVVNFFEFIAQEVRELLASLGARTLQEVIGRVELLTGSASQLAAHEKIQGLALDAITHVPAVELAARSRRIGQDHGLEAHLDQKLLAAAQPALRDRIPVVLDAPIVNTDRSVGTLLGHHVTKTFGIQELAADTIQVNLTGRAGQSLGAFLPAGITVQLSGDANDYVGKGLSGGRIAIHPPHTTLSQPEEQVIAGNVVGYGATSGELFINGMVGERFAVRNSGASIVTEGIGEHGCEYMTGGQVLILGQTGRNFGAGFSGGTAWVLDFDRATLNPLAAAQGDLLIGAVTDAEAESIFALLTEHIALTASPLAQRLVLDWENTRTRLSSIIPRDFAAVQQVRAQAAADGENPDSPQVWSKILEVTRG